jgi:hypothetical protein
MIPTVLEVACLGAILWPTRVWVVAGASVWMAVMSIGGLVSSPDEFVSTAAVAVANSAIGFAIGWTVRRQTRTRP